MQFKRRYVTQKKSKVIWRRFTESLSCQEIIWLVAIINHKFCSRKMHRTDDDNHYEHSEFCHCSNCAPLCCTKVGCDCRPIITDKPEWVMIGSVVKAPPEILTRWGKVVDTQPADDDRREAYPSSKCIWDGIEEDDLLRSIREGLYE